MSPKRKLGTGLNWIHLAIEKGGETHKYDASAIQIYAKIRKIWGGVSVILFDHERVEKSDLKGNIGLSPKPLARNRSDRLSSHKRRKGNGEKRRYEKLTRNTQKKITT